MPEDLRNWAGNVTYSARRVLRPGSREEVQDAVRAAETFRAVGTRHSFNRIADTTGDLISLERMNRVLGVDRANRTVTIEGGVRYGELGVFLQAEGFALHNMASLPHISVVGACATATHGSGETLGNLATAVCSLEIVTLDGEVVSLSRGDPGFASAVVSAGRLGVVTQMTLDVEPAFDVVQTVYENLPFGEMEAHFDEIQASGYSVSLFTDWASDSINQVWLKRRMDRPYATLGTALFGAMRADGDRHPIPGISAENCTPQMGVPGPWHARLPHFRLEFTPSSGEELQSEYFVPRVMAMPALRAIKTLGAEIAPWLLISEIRTIAADELESSPHYRRDSVAVHFTWKPDWPAVRDALYRIEGALAAFDFRAHAGKLSVAGNRDEHAPGYH